MDQSEQTEGTVMPANSMALVKAADALLEAPAATGDAVATALAAAMSEHDELRSLIHEVVHATAHGHSAYVVADDDADMSPTDAALRLGISRKLLTKMLDAGELRSYTLPLSTHRKIPAAEVVRVLREREAVRSGVDGVMEALAEAEY